VQPDSTQQDAAEDSTPACAKRVGDIFDNPKFYVERDAHVKDMRQRAEGNCRFISSLGCLCVHTQFPELVEKLCPAEERDEKVGVYGFVFFRDGEKISEITHDKLLSQKWNHYCTNANSVIYTAPRCAHSATVVY
jgi:hypothetical protein